jgi:hypothetical protein
MPTYAITDQMSKVIFVKNDITSVNMVSLRRGLVFLKALAQVTNPGITEWTNVVNIIRLSLKELRLHTK